MNSLSKRTPKNFFAVSNLKLIFITKNNLPTNLKETNSNRLSRRSLIGHHRMANLPRLISLLKNSSWTSKNSISTKASNFSNLSKEEWTAHQNLNTRDGIVIKPARQRRCRGRLGAPTLYKQEAFRTISRH